MLKILQITALLFSIAQAGIIDDILSNEWELYKYGKSYESNIEEYERFEVFKTNRHMIAQHNQLFVAGEVTYDLDVNQFTDMLPHAEQSVLNTSGSYGYEDGDNYVSNFIDSEQDFIHLLPHQKDWRNENAITKIKNQGQCGACYAFATAAAVEAYHFIQNGTLISLSEQNLIDCSDKENTCKNGYIYRALDYIINISIDSEISYPYKAEKQKCRFHKNGAVKISRYGQIEFHNEKQMQKIVAFNGPIIVSLYAGSKFFQYKSGIYDNADCRRIRRVNHSVVSVGYGTDEVSHLDYWIVKNAYGANWGEEGYIRIVRNKNMCNIANAAFYLIV